MLFAGVGRNELERVGENLSIICFNYDRCLEVGLVEALRTIYQVDLTRAFAIIGNLNIIHPYGHLGYLSVAPQIGGGVGFGDTRADPWAVATNLRTFTEGAGERTRVDDMHAAINNAHALVFLGFSFHAQNLALMTPPQRSGGIKHVYSTGKGTKPAALRDLRRRLGGLYGATERVVADDQYWHIEPDETCQDLFATHGASWG